MDGVIDSIQVGHESSGNNQDGGAQSNSEDISDTLRQKPAAATLEYVLKRRKENETARDNLVRKLDEYKKLEEEERVKHSQKEIKELEEKLAKDLKDRMKDSNLLGGLPLAREPTCCRIIKAICMVLLRSGLKKKEPILHGIENVVPKVVSKEEVSVQ